MKAITEFFQYLWELICTLVQRMFTGDETDPPPPPPNVHLVRMAESCAYYGIDDTNESGYPLFENLGEGKARPGDYILVEVDFIVGDGGELWWCIWKGEHGDISKRGYYIKKDKTRKV